MREYIVDYHTFKFRVGDSEEAGGCTLIGGEWKDVTTNDLFKGKKIVMFSLPGAFTPTCSGQELPSYDKMYQQFKDLGMKYESFEVGCEEITAEEYKQWQIDKMNSTDDEI